MNITLILGHPTKGSFNHSIADTAASKLRENGHEVTYHDLYAERFDPLLFGEEIPKDAEAYAAWKTFIGECTGLLLQVARKKGSSGLKMLKKLLINIFHLNEKLYS